MKKLNLILLCALTVIAAACSKDDPEPEPSDVITPNQTVDDPNGTILLSMRNSDGTSLDGLYIGSDNNFHGTDWMIASYGKVKGLGNVVSIPADGWASKVSVQPGHGYVAYNRYSDTYMRLFVMEYMVAAGSDAVIGADVKYQKPFGGLDEAISLESTQVVLPAEGGTEQVVFQNRSIVPFSVTSSEEWCQVRKASTREYGFLYDAIVVSCEESYSAQEQSAQVTIETEAGKKTVLNVKRAPRGEFISLSRQSIDIGFNVQATNKNVSVFTNVAPSDIVITSDSDWLSAMISESAYSPMRQVRWIEGKPLSRATLENPVEKEMIVSVAGYVGSESRTGHLTLSYGNATVELTVNQSGSGFSLSQHTFVFEESSSAQSQTCYFYGKWSGSDLSAEIPEDAKDWLSVTISGGYDYYYDKKMTVMVQPNPYEETRTAKVKICCKAYGDPIEVDEITVTQKGTAPYDRYVFFQSPASNETVTFPILPGAKITSSASWCTGSANGSSIVIRATATTEDRSAVITVEGVSSKIYVLQNKYKVGDTYDEGGVTGTIIRLEPRFGIIFKKLDGQYAWSTENIDIRGAGSYTDGEANTSAIHEIPGWQELYPAFAAVEALNTDGVTGWYMPALRESSELYFGNSWWSSTQYDTTRAWSLALDNISADYWVKTSNKRVVAVHRFSYDFSNK